MIAGQRWSAATKSDKIALLRAPLSSVIMGRLCIPAERDAARSQAGDGEQEIGGLWGIGTVAGELRRSLRRDEAGVAVLPSVELAVEEGTALPVIRQSRQVGIDAGEGVGNPMPGRLFPTATLPAVKRWLHYVYIL